MESRTSVRKLGLIVNPIAGMGGAVALKGTDGAVERARRLGAQPIANARAATAMRALGDSIRSRGGIEVVAAVGEMGERVARDAGFDVRVSAVAIHATGVRAAAIPALAMNGASPGFATTSADTRSAALAMMKAGVDLLLFAGGDGTARDIYDVVGERIPILGIPSGVKMHSAVFGISAASAGEVAARYISGDAAVEPAEVMDRDDERQSPRLFGFARTPRVSRLTQYAKSTPRTNEDAELRSACRRMADLARDDAITILGPGTTMQLVKQYLGFDGTLDGVDVVSRGQPVALDATAARLLDLLEGCPARIVVTIIGGQGYLFGRGNQQISAEVIRRVGRDHIHVIAAKSKLLALPDQCLFVDTGDAKVDTMLAGYQHVWTSAHERMVYRVNGGGACARAS